VTNPRSPLHRQSAAPAADIWTTAAQRAAEARAKAIETAVTGWAAQAGLTVEEWLKLYGYSVETKFEGLTVRFVVRPRIDFPGQEVVFTQPPPPAAD
jgi:hypothetical protein